MLRQRLDGALWSNHPEVVAKRSDLLQRALAADPLLGTAIPHMMVMEHRARFSAAQVLRLLDSPACPAPDAPQARIPPCFFQPLLVSIEVAVVRKSHLAGRDTYVWMRE